MCVEHLTCQIFTGFYSYINGPDIQLDLDPSYFIYLFIACVNASRLLKGLKLLARGMFLKSLASLIGGCLLFPWLLLS